MRDNTFTRLDDEIEYALLKARRLFFCDGVDRDSCSEMIRKLWYLELTAPGDPILFVINSPGGSVDAGFAVWDQVSMITAPITTLVTGMAASMGSILALCAPKGRRFATPNARFLIHQPSMPHGIRGPATDIEIHAEEIVKTRERIVDLYTEITGRERSVVAKALDRDYWMSPESALEFGLIDRIVKEFSEID
ncbi:MAG: ATP-dependent Clp protease proteolytic subunit [Myxococcales bacterium FL481]|nr:MAG: ATP-dependent Clp protease proteolytic subunit [Myxococcales bacterium FL481]